MRTKSYSENHEGRGHLEHFGVGMGGDITKTDLKKNRVQRWGLDFAYSGQSSVSCKHVIHLRLPQKVFTQSVSWGAILVGFFLTISGKWT
jgi:hypothetical protein